MKLTSCKNCGVVVDMDNGDNIKNPEWAHGHGPKDLKETVVHESCIWDGEEYKQTWTCRVCDYPRNIVPE